MADIIDLDRRRPLPANHVFEATDDFDPTNYHLECWRDEDDMGIYVNFVEERGPGDAIMKAGMWLSGEKCEQFAHALLAAAKIIHEADAKSE